ncbi:hypothetical protein [Pseudomonas sp. CGJS7]|uniref:hypothetical protein n=1 Tax=Pseudomonas sp. CGJS7 TaxID=3109348 RepID=UPI00300A9DBB
MNIQRPRPRTLALALSALLAAGLLSACNKPPTETPAPDPAATAPADTTAPSDTVPPPADMPPPAETPPTDAPPANPQPTDSAPPPPDKDQTETPPKQ